jgi:hypothetical protein
MDLTTLSDDFLDRLLLAALAELNWRGYVRRHPSAVRP